VSSFSSPVKYLVYLCVRAGRRHVSSVMRSTGLSQACRLHVAAKCVKCTSPLRVSTVICISHLRVQLYQPVTCPRHVSSCTSPPRVRDTCQLYQPAILLPTAWLKFTPYPVKMQSTRKLPSLCGQALRHAHTSTPHHHPFTLLQSPQTPCDTRCCLPAPR
jgi:hypothetical protein